MRAPNHNSGARVNEKEQTTDAPDHQVATFEFEKFTCVWELRRFAGNDAERHRIGAYFYGTKGTLNIGWRDGWTFYPANESDKLLHEDAQLQEPDGHNLLNHFRHRTCSRSAGCSENSNDSSGASKSGTGLEAATQRAKQKIMDNSIQAPRITNNTVVILNTLLSSQRAARKTRAILGKLEGLSCPEAAGVPIRYAVVPFMGFPVYFPFAAPRVFRAVVVAFPNAIQ